MKVQTSVLAFAVLMAFGAVARPVELSFPESIRYGRIRQELMGDWITAEVGEKANVLCAELEASVDACKKLLGGDSINYEDFKGELADKARSLQKRQGELVAALEDLLGLYAYATNADYNDFFRGGRTHESSLDSWGKPRDADQLRGLLECAVQISYPLNGDDFVVFRRCGFSSQQQAETLWQIVEKYGRSQPGTDQYRMRLNAAYWFNRFGTDDQAGRLKPLSVGNDFENRYFGFLLRQRKNKRWLSVRRQYLVADEMERFYGEGAKGGKPAFLERIRQCGASAKEIIVGLFVVADTCCQKPRGSNLEKLGVMALEYTVPLEAIADKNERPDCRYSFIAQSSRNECAWTALKCYYDYHERIGSPFGKWALKSAQSSDNPNLTPEQRKQIEALLE